MTLWTGTIRAIRRGLLRRLVHTQVIDHNRMTPLQGRTVYIIEADRWSHRELVHTLSEHQYPSGTVLALHRRNGSCQSDLQQLIETQRQQPRTAIQLIPVGIYHGRLPKRERNWLRLMFAEGWGSHNLFRRSMQLLLNGRQTLIRISPPLALEQIAECDEPLTILSERTEQILHSHFRSSRQAMLGPDLSHRRTLLEHTLADSGLQQAITHAASESNQSRDELERQCRENLNQIAANLNGTTARLFQILLSWVWRRLYHRIRVVGAEQLQDRNRHQQLVYLPCHRSHLDYLLLSYMLYEHGLMLPHIAAGENLNIPLIGPLLRGGGAIFMRRRFQGDPLYGECFRAYLSHIAAKGHSLEYFIEGGRSRTGRLLPPKTGLLQMTVDNFLQAPDKAVTLVPVWISYDRLVESRTYQQELAGAGKRKESLTGFLSTLRILREKYGEASLAFGAPIELQSLTTLNSSRVSVDQLAHRVMRGINGSCVVNSSAMLATVLLARPTDIHNRTGLSLQLEQLLALFNALPNPPLAVPDTAPAQWFDHSVRLGILDADKNHLIELNASQCAELVMYRNNILHLSILPGLILLLIQRLDKPLTQSISRLLNQLYPILQNELFLPWPATSLSPVIQSLLSALKSQGLIEQHQQRWQLCQSPLALTLIQTAEPIILRYYLCLSLLQKYPGINEEDLIDSAAALASKVHSLFGFESREYADKKVFKAFITAQRQAGVLQREGDQILPAVNLRAIFRQSERVLRPQLLDFIKTRL